MKRRPARPLNKTPMAGKMRISGANPMAFNMHSFLRITYIYWLWDEPDGKRAA
jgi:hypothetical protein